MKLKPSQGRLCDDQRTHRNASLCRWLRPLCVRHVRVGDSMTSQQFADELLAHWRLLWPLPAAERIKRIDELRLDMEFEEQLSLVSVEMANPELV